MDGPLNLGIVGAGYIADVVATALRGTDAVRACAVASRRPETASAYAAKHGIRAVHDSWRGLLDDASVRAVYIATPTVVREEIALAAAASGRHVLADKPFADAGSVRRIAAACAAAGVAFMDATHFTHHPRTARLRRELPGHVGAVRAVRTSFFFPSADRANIRFRPDKEPGGAIGDMAWYSMRAIAEYVPQAGLPVACHGFADRDAVTGGFVRGAGVVRFADGLTSCWDAGYTVGSLLMDLELLGEKGAVAMDDFVLDWAGGLFVSDTSRPVGFTCRNGVATPSTYLRVETPSEKRQATLMMDHFAALARDPGSAAAAEAVRLAEHTQSLVDAVIAGLHP